jgi:hypothetical protein
LIEMPRLLCATGVIVCLALSACGGGNDSSSTTTTDQTAVHWTRCAGGFFQISTAGMSCHAAKHFVSKEALGKTPSGGTNAQVNNSDPRNFTAKPFECTGFPVGRGAAWHVLCVHGDQHVSFYITP